MSRFYEKRHNITGNFFIYSPLDKVTKFSKGSKEPLYEVFSPEWMNQMNIKIDSFLEQEEESTAYLGRMSREVADILLK